MLNSVKCLIKYKSVEEMQMIIRLLEEHGYHDAPGCEIDRNVWDTYGSHSIFFRHGEFQRLRPAFAAACYGNNHETLVKGGYEELKQILEEQAAST